MRSGCAMQGLPSRSDCPSPCLCLYLLILSVAVPCCRWACTDDMSPGIMSVAKVLVLSLLVSLLDCCGFANPKGHSLNPSSSRPLYLGWVKCCARSLSLAADSTLHRLAPFLLPSSACALICVVVVWHRQMGALGKEILTRLENTPAKANTYAWVRLNLSACVILLCVSCDQARACYLLLSFLPKLSLRFVLNNPCALLLVQCRVAIC